MPDTEIRKLIQWVAMSSIFLRRLAIGLLLSVSSAHAADLTNPFSPVDYNAFDQAVSGNPAATTFNAGTGWLGRALGIPEDSGVSFGGLWLGDTNTVFSGGAQPGAWSSNSSLVLSLKIDAQKLWGWRGASFGVQYLQFYGQNTNGEAGSVQGYNGIVGSLPFQRNELYQAWYLQEIIPDTLQIRLGRTTPTLDFNNVLRPLTLKDSEENIPSVSGLLYTPVFVNPTLLGALPGYYNSAAGVTVNFTPNKEMYVNVGSYDGNLANGVQTGMTTPSFNGYYFSIAETGTNWLVGEDRHPGQFAVGAWYQSGVLSGPGNVQQNGTSGVYFFGTQRIWSGAKYATDPNTASSEKPHAQAGSGGHPSVSVFYQYGINNADTLPVNQYAGGGATAFGLVSGRPNDSMGVGVALSWLNPKIFQRPTELMFQAYYQAQVANAVFLQPTLTYIPTPGAAPNLPGAWAGTLRMTVLF